MRPPRADVAWSQGRVRRRSRYSTYITSPEWFARRERWLEQWKTRHRAQAARGLGPACVIAGCEWSLEAGDLHHVTYQRLGAERYEDLVPMCRSHHSRFHDIYDTHPAWRRMGRHAATRGIITALRREATR